MIPIGVTRLSLCQICSTSNHNSPASGANVGSIVLYLCSTSNHNYLITTSFAILIVLYLCSTSNHNTYASALKSPKLSYISVLHQTTTTVVKLEVNEDCLISLFYIKPQRIAVVIRRANGLSYISVLHQTTTHCIYQYYYRLLSYISVLHQTTTNRRQCRLCSYCLISLFYIKPQRILHNSFNYRHLHPITHTRSG